VIHLRANAALLNDAKNLIMNAKDSMYINVWRTYSRTGQNTSWLSCVQISQL